MAVLNFVEETEIKKIPVEFQCDICKSIFTLKGRWEYGIECYSDVKYQMAVVKYSYPAGNWGERDETSEIHCCSTNCLSKAIKKVPFSADITIPTGGFYQK